MKKKIAVGASLARVNFSDFFLRVEDPNSLSPPFFLFSSFSQCLEADDTMLPMGRSGPFERCDYEVLESGGLKLQLHYQKNKSVSYILSKALLDQFDYFKAFIRFIAFQETQKSHVDPEIVSGLHKVLSQCHHFEEIQNDDFENKLTTYFYENLGLHNYNEIFELHKNLNYLQYKPF